MEFKSVKEVGFEEKSAQEIEQELVAKHENAESNEEEKIEKITIKEEASAEEVEEEIHEDPAPITIDDEIVLSHIRKKYNREDLSYEDLLQKEIVEKELPEDLDALYRYKQETGRGINDFVKLNRDIENENPDTTIAEYIAIQNPEYDNDDIQFEMDRAYSYDEDLDDEDDIRARKIAKKKILASARKFFNEEKEKYRAPLESRESFASDSDREADSQREENERLQNEKQERSNRNKEYFSAKTNELFSNNFEGFGYNVGDNKITLKINDVESVKNMQSDAMNFIGKHLDEEGKLKDANAYHKALNAAMDPDALFKFAYEKGAADAVERDTKEAKNIEMKARGSSQVVNEGFKVREVNASHGSGLRIKSNKK